MFKCKFCENLLYISIALRYTLDFMPNLIHILFALNSSLAICVLLAQRYTPWFCYDDYKPHEVIWY